MDILKAIFLGVIQGFTEYLPISSSGHLMLLEEMLKMKADNNLIFNLLLHVATCCSTVFVFHKKIGNLFGKTFSTFAWNEEKKYVALLLISCVPIMFVGFLFMDKLEKIYEGNLVLVGFCFIITALSLFGSNYVYNRNSSIKLKKEIGVMDALLLGFAQAVATLPGLSRSGFTISTGMFCGCDKKAVTEFSFLMVLIPIFGKVLLDIFDIIKNGWVAYDLAVIPAVVGFCVAFVCGCIACRWMIAIVQRQKLTYFAYYCLVLGIITLAYEFC